MQKIKRGLESPADAVQVDRLLEERDKGFGQDEVVAHGDLQHGGERLPEVDLGEAAVEAGHHQVLHFGDEGA